MSLILTLIAAAVLVLAGLWAWGRWQVRKVVDADGTGAQSVDSVSTLARPARADPTMSLTTSPAIVPPPMPLAASDFVFADALDEDCEMIATLTPADALDQDAIRRVASHRTTTGRKPVRYQLLQTEPAGIRMGLTLADRTGAVSEAEINHFLRLVDECADAWSADVQVETVDAAIARARLLDAQCAALDTQIHLHLAGGEPAVSEQALEDALTALGVTQHPNDDSWSLKDAAGQEIARVFARSDRPEAFASFVVDVPRVPQNAFEKAFEAAQKLAENLGAQVVDDNGKPLTDTALALVRARLTDVSRKMAEAGMPAGSDRARRLFA